MTIKYEFLKPSNGNYLSTILENILSTGAIVPTSCNKFHQTEDILFLNFVVFKFLSYIWFLKVYLFERERERERMCTHMQWGGVERERGRESQAVSTKSAQNPMQGSNSRTMRSLPEPKMDT